MDTTNKGPNDAANEEGLVRARAERDAAYHDRDVALALLARLAASIGWRVGTRAHEGPPVAPEFSRVLFVETPEGQLSWHFHASEAALFEHLPDYPTGWDRHTTEEKHARIRATVEKIDAINAQLAGKLPR